MRSLLPYLLLLVSSCGFAQTTQVLPSPVSESEEERAEAHLKQRLAIWQERLGLSNWTVFVILSHPNGLRSGTLGNIRWDMDKRTAVIRVLHPSDYRTPLPASMKDMEFTLVHELIHLMFASLPRNEESRTEEEHSVNNLAAALLKLDSTAAR
ncbi:MAG: hypothetical protein HY820_00690 [Acidobacteria bacterium]|nr:hypothetical protein [Acidobacteriota bacterium]